MTVEWYYRLGAEDYGPVSQQELDALLRTGTLAPSDLVRMSTQQEWRRIELIWPRGRGASSGDAWSQTVRDALVAQRSRHSDPQARLIDGDQTSRLSLADVAGHGINAIRLPFQWAAGFGGLMARPMDGLADMFSVFGERPIVQVAIRGVFVFASIVITAVAIRAWAAHAALENLSTRGVRFGLQSGGESNVACYLPLIGPCSVFEYWSTFAIVLLFVAVLAFIASDWLLSAEDD